MVRMLNRITNTEMYVSEDRVKEYEAMGHTVMSGSLISELAKKEPELQIEANPDPIGDTAKKLKETVAKTKKTTRKRA